MIKDMVVEIAKSVGKPLTVSSPEELFNTFKDFLAYCEAKGKPVTVSGFCCYIDAWRGLLYEYSKKPEYSHTIKKIRMYIENDLEEKAMQDNCNVTFAIFSMKNNFDWTDKTQNDNKNSFVDKDGNPIDTKLTVEFVKSDVK
jgi:hypothetical protein